MPGLGELVFAAVKTATESQLAGKTIGFVAEHLSTLAGGLAGGVTDDLLDKTGIQKEVDGTVYFNLPFLKGIDGKINDLVALHPERKKLLVHVRETLNTGACFYDETGKEIYRIRPDRKNVKHLCLYEGASLVGEVRRKKIQNPISFSDMYSITVLGKQLGDLKLAEKKLFWTYIEPSYDSWTLRQTRKGGVTYHMIERKSAEDERETGTIYLAGSKNYVLDYEESYDAFRRIEMILSFLIIEMQRGADHISYQRQKVLTQLEP